MISLDIDFSYLNRCYNIGYQTLEMYRGKSIAEIMEIEAQKGNAKAAQFLIKILSDPKELVKLFNLIEPKNKYMILSNMNEDDLLNIMQYIEPEQLILGLSIFNQDALVELMMKLDPEALATVVLEQMDANMFVDKLPEKFLNEFLTSEEINKNIIFKAMESVEESQLQKMMESFTGESCYDGKDDIIAKMASLDDDNFKRAMLAFDPEGKRQLAIGILQIKPDLFEVFSPEAMVYPFKNMQKDDILKALTVLETKELMPMVEDLPQDIMALVAAQIDPNTFAQVLCKDFSDVIASLGVDVS